jgi:hypothetical protein
LQRSYRRSLSENANGFSIRTAIRHRETVPVSLGSRFPLVPGEGSTFPDLKSWHIPVQPDGCNIGNDSNVFMRGLKNGRFAAGFVFAMLPALVRVTM